MSIKWMGKQVVVHWYNGRHFSNKKEGTINAKYIVNKPQTYNDE